MSALFLELDRPVLFLSFPLAPHGEVSKSLPVVRLEMKYLPGSVDAVVGIELVATTFADKNRATLLPNYVLVRHLQRIESLFTYITRVNPLHMLLKADPSLEGNVGDDTDDPSLFHRLGQLSVLQYFEGRLAPLRTKWQF